MQTGLRWIATACLIGATALAQNGAASKPASRPTPTTPAEKLAAIEAEYSDAMKAFQEAYKNAKTEEEKDKVFEEKYPKADVWFPRLIEIAKGGAEDKVAVGALVWVVSHGATSGEAKEAVALLAEKHLTSPELKKVFGPLARSTSKANEDLIRKALASSPHEEVKAQASYSLAQMLKYRGELAAMLAEPLNEEMRKSLEKRFDADERAALAAIDTKAAGKEVEQLLESAKEMATGKPWGEKLAETIVGDLYEIKNLAIGMVAPDIEAEDLDGKPMKLTDFRGKVVVLDFWGNWWGPCKAMYPHERSLVKRLADKQFALVGINSDKDRDELKPILEKENITWPSFWNGGSTRGPISKAWNVRGWPTIYILDSKGVIRFKNKREKAMDTAVDKLLEEMGPASRKSVDELEAK